MFKLSSNPFFLLGKLSEFFQLLTLSKQDFEIKWKDDFLKDYLVVYIKKKINDLFSLKEHVQLS